MFVGRGSGVVIGSGGGGEGERVEVGQPEGVCVWLVQDQGGGRCEVGAEEREAVSGAEVFHRLGEAAEASQIRRAAAHFAIAAS